MKIVPHTLVPCTDKLDMRGTYVLLGLVVASSFLFSCERAVPTMYAIGAASTSTTASPTIALQAPSTSPANDTTPTVRVSGVQIGDTVDIYIDSCSNAVSSSGVAVADTVDVTLPVLADGSYSFMFIVNNGSCSVSTVSYTLDATAPSLPSALALVTPASSPSSDATPEIRISGLVSGDTAKLYSDAACTTEVASGSVTGGTLDLTSSTLSGDNTYVFKAKAFDSLGNDSGCSTASVSYTLDTIGPMTPGPLAITSPVAQPGGSSTPQITVSSVASGDTVKLYSDSSCSTEMASGVAAGSTINLVSSALFMDGVYLFYSKSIDSSGNSSACSSAYAQYYYSSGTVDIQFSLTTKDVNEGSGSENFAVVMSASKTYPVTVYYEVSGTADGNHHNLSSGSLVFTAGSTNQNISFNILENGLTDGTKYIQIKLLRTDSVAANIGNKSEGFVYIRDNESVYVNAADTTAGGDHACGIRADGKLMCWGDNGVGQIGDGTTTMRLSPVTIDGANSYSKISAGSFHTCGITTGGVLKCWGYGLSGRLGDGGTSTSLSPVVIDGGTTYLFVSAGYNHTCGITTANQLKCWGQNLSGRIGDGSTTDRLVPVVIDSGNSYSSVSAGGAHTCAITTTGILKCWGSQLDGRLGDGIDTTGSVLTPISIDGATTYSEISAGDMHTCGITTAGVLKCWGSAAYFQLGNGSSTNQLTPLIIEAGITYQKVSSGASHTCAVKTNGSLKCWGQNALGQIGTGAFSPFQQTPFVIDEVSYTTIKAGNGFSCGITVSGDLKCWGSNISGETGQGKVSRPSVFTTQQAVNTITDIAYSLDYEYYPHACRIETSQKLYCSGSNNYGALGDGTYTSRANSIQVDANTSYVKVASNKSYYAYNTCGITTTGVLKCWGYNFYGQVGDGTTTVRNLPSIVDAGVSYSKIAIGMHNACGLTTAGVLKCWGQNDHGEVGDNSVTQRNSPVIVDAGTSYSEISMGQDHTCGITTTGVLKCWGLQEYGRLGNNVITATSVLTPTIIDGGTQYSQISAGQAYTCGITSANVLKCWGYDGYNQIGNGAGSINEAIPAIIDAGVSYKSIAAGYIHTCGITMSDDLKCWGSNGFNQMGALASTTPILVDTGVAYSKVFVAYDVTCGITLANSFKCSGNNQWSKFGDGSVYILPRRVLGFNGL